MRRRTKLPSKRDLIETLKRIYKELAYPFTKIQYDQRAPDEYRALVVVKVFGSWQEALIKSGLSKKFKTHKSISSQVKEFDPEKELKKTWDKEKERLLERAEKRRIKWIKDQTHKVDLLGEMIDEAIAKAEPIPVFHNKKPTKATEKTYVKNAAIKPHATLWFEFSDLQLGTLMTKEEMGGINEHNWLIWQQKLAVWKNLVIEKINFYKSVYDIDHVVLACLGDMVEGQDIFRGQMWQIDRHVVDQAIMGANDTATSFAEIMLENSDLKFEILEVFGNHGRLGHKGDLPYACSMDKVYQRMLESQLKGIKELTNYTYHHNESWFYFLEIYGWHHLLLHGDQGMSKMWSNRPTVNGLEKGLVRYNQMFQQQVHFLHCGHFHSPVNWSFNVSQILINGSFIGTSNYSATKMVASSPPVQLMYVFEPRVGLDVTQRLYLTKESVKAPIQPRTLKDEKV